MRNTALRKNAWARSLRISKNKKVSSPCDGEKCRRGKIFLKMEKKLTIKMNVYII